MNSSSLDKGFEKFRRERNRRRLDSGTPLRPLGENAEVLRQLERAEAAEVHDRKLTREVHDFFQGATKTAADIVARMAEDMKERSSQQIDDEMAQFLMETLQRMEQFVRVINSRKGPALGEQILEAELHNIVGPTLDGFRSEGTAQIGDKHIGQDPFHHSAPVPGKDVPVYSSPMPRPPEEDREEPSAVRSVDLPRDDVDEMLADRFDDEPATTAREPEARRRPDPVPPAAAGDLGGRPNQFLLAGISDDPQRLREALKLLVQSGLMSKDEALQVYRNSVQR